MASTGGRGLLDTSVDNGIESADERASRITEWSDMVVAATRATPDGWGRRTPRHGLATGRSGGDGRVALAARGGVGVSARWGQAEVGGGAVSLKGDQQRWALARVVAICAAATLTSMAFGYDVGVISGSLEDMATTLNLSTLQREAATSGLSFVAAIGAIGVSGGLLDWVGRKASIKLASVLLIAGAVTVSLARSFPTLLLGRSLQGLGSGCTIAATSVYITELAPAEYRGALVSLADIGINLGILLGYCVDYWVRVELADTPSERWRLSMGLAGVLPLLFLAVAPLLPETPRFLMMAGRDTEALEVLQRVTCCGDFDAAGRVMTELKVSMARQSGRCALSRHHTGSLNAGRPSAPGGRQQHQPRGSRRLSAVSLMPEPGPVRPSRVVAVAVGLGVAQQLTGTDAILYYTPSIFSGRPGGKLGTTMQFYANLAVGSCKFVGELVAAWLTERTGRRSLMIGGNLLLSAAVIVLACNFRLWNNDVVAILCLSLAMFGFSIGAGPLTLVVVNEMLPLHLRGRIVASTVAANRVTAGIVALTFLTLERATGVVNLFFMYGGIGLVVTAWYAAVLPELSGWSLEGPPPQDARGQEAADDDDGTEDEPLLLADAI
mmetsp:Transcript_3672/g.11516  ORF Transcript_3672/g.11516 Transcript_3672/m.11516 type:complete len:609 (+) Transcript_3672:193-2019(+)